MSSAQPWELDASRSGHRRVHHWLLPVVVGTVVRVVWIVRTADAPHLDRIADPVIYQLAAEKAAHLDFSQTPDWPWGIDQPTSFLTVGYPNLLGLISWTTGRAVSVFAAAMTVNVVASALLVLGIAHLAASITYRHRWAAAVAPWVAALYPDLVTASGLVMSDIVGVTALVWLAVSMLRPRVRSAEVGALLAATIWFRPSLQLLVLVVPAVVWRWAGRRVALSAAGVALLLLAPLAYHSSVTVGVPVFTSATWVNICDGAATDPHTPSGTFRASPRCRFPDEPIPSEREWSAFAREVAVEAIRDDPVGWAADVPARLVHALGGFWGIEISQHWSGHLGESRVAGVIEDVSDWSFWLVFIGGLIGAAIAWRQRAIRLAALIAVVSLSGVAISFGVQRYGLPIVVLVCIPGLGVAADRTYDCLNEHR